ncbi:hypothetical protein I7I53_07402 [Histoplasma capsulatum var. duboisii H88]|uniref:Uncharacterized protein n=1 Tax=Ajellomyces capsulatus (strain H88) TaxID=544711 RepID=A0A8A1LC02_AJEC8|nr:hypothetical protein I7I53_07402 [Histoplasma capsulatum var. duboisii H88]
MCNIPIRKEGNTSGIHGGMQMIAYISRFIEHVDHRRKHEKKKGWRGGVAIGYIHFRGSPQYFNIVKSNPSCWESSLTQNTAFNCKIDITPTALVDSEGSQSSCRMGA